MKIDNKSEIKPTLAILWSALRAHLPQDRLLAKAISISVLNQMISSATNFALGLYLVRMLQPAEFGLYSISFAICLFYSGIGNALFLTQMVVHTPDKMLEDRMAYAMRMLILVAIFCVSTVLISALIVLVGRELWSPIAEHTSLGIAIAAASAAYLLKDFFIRHAYNKQKESWALTINSVVALMLVVMLWTQNYYKFQFSVEIALWIYALANASAAVYGYILAGLRFYGITKSALVFDAREAWRGGRWASITNFVYFIRIHAHTIIVTTVVGPLGVANLSAARLLVTPAVMLTPALGQVAMPRLASMRLYGSRKIINASLSVGIGLLMVAILYSVILLLAYDWIVSVVLGDKYTDLFTITMMWCLYTCLLALRNGAEIAMQVLNKFKKLSAASFFSAFVSLIATYWLVMFHGTTGALIGISMGELAMITLIYLNLKRVRTSI